MQHIYINKPHAVLEVLRVVRDCLSIGKYRRTPPMYNSLLCIHNKCVVKVQKHIHLPIPFAICRQNVIVVL